MEMTPHQQQSEALFEEWVERFAHLNDGPVFTKEDAVAFAALCLEKREQTEFKAVAEISERLKFSIDFMANAEKMLPTDFVMWYSGMPMEKLLKAYERFNKEKK